MIVGQREQKYAFFSSWGVSEVHPYIGIWN